MSMPCPEVEAASKVTGVPVKTMMAACRIDDVVKARWLAMAALDRRGWPGWRIAEAVGLTCRSTVSYSLRQLKSRNEYYEPLVNQVATEAAKIRGERTAP